MKLSRYSLMVIVATLAGVAVAGGFFASHIFAAPPAGLDLARSKLTEKGLFIAGIEPEAGSFKQNEMHSWVLSLTKPDGTPVEDAGITVDGGMPDHNHGLPTSPQVTAHLGKGRYRVEGVKFNMGGWWVLRFAISSPAGDDEAVFNLTL